MTDACLKQFGEELLRMIERDEPLNVLRNKLSEGKTGGLSQQAALQLLQQLRGIVSSETKEDRVLELMDFAWGFCSPALRIWESSAPK